MPLNVAYWSGGPALTFGGSAPRLPNDDKTGDLELKMPAI
jgi:hypothetical protein